MKFTDQIGRSLSLPHPPQRIVSLCPSLTETLYDLGLDSQVVGRTRFCLHPKEKVKSAIRVGGTKEIKYDRLHTLEPDLIIAEKEENTPEMVAELSRNYPVWVGNVQDIAGALDMIQRLGALTRQNSQANDLRNAIDLAWSSLPSLAGPLRTLYVIWQDPIMGVGRPTYIDAVLRRIGLQNVLEKHDSSRYPSLTGNELAQLDPELILLSSEPYPFKEQHIAAFNRYCPNARVLLVDGEMFSWYGSRMLPAASYLRTLLQAL